LTTAFARVVVVVVVAKRERGERDDEGFFEERERDGLDLFIA